MVPPHLHRPQNLYSVTSNVYVSNNTNNYFGFTSAPILPNLSLPGFLAGIGLGMLLRGNNTNSYGYSPGQYYNTGVGTYPMVGDSFTRTSATTYQPYGRLIYDNYLGGRIYDNGYFGQQTLSQPTTPQPATPQPATPQPVTPQPTTTQPATPQPTTPQPVTPQNQNEGTVNSGDGVPSAAYLNQLINSDKSGKITNKSGNTIDVSNNAGVDNVKAGKANKTDHSVTDDQTLAANGYMKFFSIVDKSGNIYTLTDPKLENGKLTYKVDVDNSDLTADDNGSDKKYEPNGNYDKETRLEVKIVAGEIVLYNESGQPIARK